MAWPPSNGASRHGRPGRTGTAISQPQPASCRKRASRGQCRARDLGHFAAIAVGGAVLVAAMPWAAGWLKAHLAQALQFDARTVANLQAMLERLAELTATMMWMVLPLGLLMTLVAVGVSAASGGLNFTLEPLQPKFAFLNPIAGVGRLFSRRRLIETLQACLLAAILGTIGALSQGPCGRLRALLGMTCRRRWSRAPPRCSAASPCWCWRSRPSPASTCRCSASYADRLKMSHQEAKQEPKSPRGNQGGQGKQKAKMREIRACMLQQPSPRPTWW